MEALNIFGGLAGIGTLAAGLGFAYSQFKSGSNKAKDDLILTLEKTAKEARETATRLAEEKSTLIKSHQDQLTELNRKLGVLQGQAEANEKKMNEYLSILQNRNPEQTKFMEIMVNAAKSSNSMLPSSQRYMRDTTKILKESIIVLKDIKEFMGQMRANGYLVKKVNIKN